MGVFVLIQLTSLSWLLLNWIQSSSPAQRQQAKWLLLSLSIPLLQLSSFFLPAQCASRNYPLPHALVAGLDAVADSLDAVSC